MLLLPVVAGFFVVAAVGNYAYHPSSLLESSPLSLLLLIYVAAVAAVVGIFLIN